MIPIKLPLVRENKPDSLALNPYLLFLCFNACSSCSGVAKVAIPLSHSPLGCPLMPDGTIRTFELFRRRFTLPGLSSSHDINHLITVNCEPYWCCHCLSVSSVRFEIDIRMCGEHRYPIIWRGGHIQ